MQTEKRTKWKREGRNEKIRNLVVNIKGRLIVWGFITRVRKREDKWVDMKK